MTYKELITAIRNHRGTVYACINAAWGQYHLPTNKAAVLATFGAEAKRHGKGTETDLTAERRVDGGLYIDTVDPNEEREL
jgi:hypothetical protein